jgi:Mrp family chromosome partitioning ATPase
MAERDSRLKHIKHKILVLSGKGGVGKSTVSSQLALCLARAGRRVGLLDIDLTGPSIPGIVGLAGKPVHQSSLGWIPVQLPGVPAMHVMSISFLMDEQDAAVIWRGPKKTATIRQFLEDVCWGDLDYLVVDTPPGTSDEHITIAELLAGYEPDGAVIVTTPQGVATSDVRREIAFCRKVGLPVLGILENMSGFVCPHCKECTLVFSQGGGQLLALELALPYLGAIPLDPSIASCGDAGLSFVQKFPEGSMLALETFVARKLAEDARTAAQQ